tara:strand:+ start:84562 stop:85398 length:837 start_codon:yes stop_codon:yes gene_type:complete
MDADSLSLETAIESLEAEMKARVQWAVSVVRGKIAFFEEHLGNVSSTFKEDQTRVTPADLELSATIMEALKERFPLDHFCSEETAEAEPFDLTSRFSWVLDPVDGTNNYIMGLSTCCISLALLEDGMPIYGIIYDSLTKSLIQGGPACGTWDGDKQVTLDPDRSFGRLSYTALQFPLPEAVLNKLLPFMEKHRSRNFGTGALNLTYAALGRFDGSISFNVKVWDIAAAYALLQAGGGQFHFFEESVFPLKRFHPKIAPFIGYYAGTSAFCSYIQELLN